MQLQEHVPLSELTTFRIGGKARYVVPVSSTDELREALDFAQERALPLFVLGGGSNILARDEGFDGVVVKMEMRGIAFDGETAVAGAGEKWDALVEQSVMRALWGLENLSGIPGSVGGAIAGGIGAYGASVGQHLAWVEAYNIDTRATERLENAQCAFGYRTSIFKFRPELVATRAAFTLSAKPMPQVSYKDLAQRFGDSALDLPTIRAAVISIREGKFPDLVREGSAGSFFKNPMLPEDKAKALQERYPSMPLFAMPEARGYKVPLAWFLDHVLHLNGARDGNVRCFERQPLVVVAQAGAHARDVRAFKEKIKKEVKAALSIDIEEEVVVL